MTNPTLIILLAVILTAALTNLPDAADIAEMVR